MTRFNYTEVKAAYAAVQTARVTYLPTFSKIEKTVDEFTTSPDLTGLGWDAAKEALSPYTVVSKALYNYHCDFGEISAAFLASFESEVGETTKVLDTDQLRDLQDRLNRIQQEKADLMENIATNILSGMMDTAGIGVFYKDFQIGQTQKKVDLLEKYETFETNHANDFAELVALGNELEQAMDDLGKSKSFDKKTGAYTYVDCSGKDWYKKISDYNTASPTQRIEIVQTDEYGYGLKVYIDGHYSKQASDNLMYAQSQDYLKEMGRTAVTMTGELTGAYDVYRLFTGKDPLTGDKTGRLEAGLWTAILLLPQAKMVMAAKELKAGNKALKGLNLTEKELNLLNKSGYFEDVGKLEKASGLTKAQKVEKFQDRINDVRNKMPNNTLKKRGNMATADVNVTGLPDTFMAHSQIDSLTDKGADLGDFSMKNSESERFFKNYEPSASTINGRKYDRFHDTEAKILEDIASKITDPNTFGTIDLFTELPACQSCSNIILEFRSKFPNIQLNIFTKN